MRLHMGTIDTIKTSFNQTEYTVLDYYINNYKLPLNTSKANVMKIIFEIGDEETDVVTVCQLLINSGIAYICLDFSSFALEKDSFLYVNTTIKEKCENKLNTFLNIVEDMLIRKTTYFTMLNRLDILGNNYNNYQYYLGQYNGGLIRQ